MSDKFRVYDTETNTMYYPKEFSRIENGKADKTMDYIDFAITTDGKILMKDAADWSHTYRALNDDFAKRFKMMRLVDWSELNDWYDEEWKSKYIMDLYENDIICSSWDWTKLPINYVIKYSTSNSWRAIGVNVRPLDYDLRMIVSYKKGFKLVGNIYQTPELLEEK